MIARGRAIVRANAFKFYYRSPDSSSGIWEDDAPKGGYIQFQLTDSRINDLDRWVPLGRIDYLKDNPEELRDRFGSADTGSDTDEFTNSVCSDDIYP